MLEMTKKGWIITFIGLIIGASIGYFYRPTALFAYSDAIRPPFRGQTGHCSDVNPATIPRGIRPAFRADSGHFSQVGRN